MTFPTGINFNGLTAYFFRFLEVCLFVHLKLHLDCVCNAHYPAQRKVYSDNSMAEDKVSTETARVAGGAQEPVGSPLSAGSSADLETPKSASSQQK